MKIAIGGSIAWMAVTLVIGLYFFVRGDRQPIDEGGLPRVPPVKPVVQEQVVLQPLAAAPNAVKADELVDAPAFHGGLPENKKEFVDCELIKVNVLFMKEPAAAFQRAQAEKKTVFIVHLSGNLEDKEFT